MSEILYIQTEKNVEVQSPEIYLQDVAKLTCKDSKVLNRNFLFQMGNREGMWFLRWI